MGRPPLSRAASHGEVAVSVNLANSAWFGTGSSVFPVSSSDSLESATKSGPV